MEARRGSVTCFSLSIGSLVFCRRSVERSADSPPHVVAISEPCVSRREQSLPLLWWLYLLFLDVGGGARVVGVCGGCVWMLFCVCSPASLL